MSILPPKAHRDPAVAGAFTTTQPHEPAKITTTYRLVLGEPGSSETFEIEAEDNVEALIAAHKLATTRSGELWQGERMLCAIRRPEPSVSASPQHALP